MPASGFAMPVQMQQLQPAMQPGVVGMAYQVPAQQQWQPQQQWQQSQPQQQQWQPQQQWQQSQQQQWQPQLTLQLPLGGDGRAYPEAQVAPPLSPQRWQRPPHLQEQLQQPQQMSQSQQRLVPQPPQQ